MGPEPELTDEEEVRPTGPLKVAIVGRPNAGKSTLLNTLLGEERMITGPEPGLTRDSIAVTLHDGDDTFEIVDTAGLRKRLVLTKLWKNVGLRFDRGAQNGGSRRAGAGCNTGCA